MRPTSARSLTRIAALAAAVHLGMAGPAAMADDAADADAVIQTHIKIAHATYEDALEGAKKLQQSVDALIASPSKETLEAAKTAWKAARVPYMQSEGFRFGNKVVDDWEGRVNSWPLDEGLIDYVDASYGDTSDANPLYAANVIANKSIRIGKEVVDTSKITKELLAKKLQQAGEVEANVATGYHAIEFLLWGQDLNGTEAGAGERPATDYDVKACTNGNCDRRAQYLKAATDLLVDDLQEMVDDWKDGGAAAKAAQEGGLSSILTGLGSLSYGELAGERIKLGVLLHDPEEEHDCFSDNTHNSHYYDQVGMMNIYTGKYTRTNGEVVSGPSMADYAAKRAADQNAKVNERMAETLSKFEAIKKTADSGEMAYDQMLGAGNEKGNQMLFAAVDALVAQTRAIEGVVSALNLKISVEGSDSLDHPDKVGSGG
jgi:putative iron-regulated protein